MKQYMYYGIKLMFCCLVFTGCDKYLDISPKGSQLLTSADDYDQWLNQETLLMGHSQPYCTFNYFGDNVDAVSVTNPPTQVAELVYTWAPQFSVEVDVSPAFWGEHYAKINLFNTVLLGVNESTGGTPTKIRSLYAEALLGRALEYFYLLNEYGKTYDPTTAQEDLAVPFVTSNDVTQVVPPRGTVEQIYRQVINDVETALPDLPDDNSANRFRGSKAAAYSVLARVYFYARDYEMARRNAALALDNSRATMIDYNGTLPASNLLSIHPDVIYGRMVLGNAPAALEFMRSFASNDLRVRTLYYSTDGYSYTTRGATIFVPAYVTTVLQYINTGTSVQEMKLILAECAARAGDLDEALQQLDGVRENRFATASYVRFESDDQEEVLLEVLKERGHELPFHGLRWLDMRRLNQENRMPTVYRYDAAGNIIATLTPDSDRYTLQIPVQVISFNPGMPQNP